MSSIHYKFSASATFRTITFNGMTISLADLKREIMEKEGLKPTEIDLTIINAQTSDMYTDPTQQINKNSSVKVQRAPLGRRPPNTQAYTVKMPKKEFSLDELKKTSNLAAVEADEEDKIKAMMDQGTLGYDKYEKRRKYAKPNDAPAPSYLRCYKCQGQGHYPNQCPIAKTSEPKTRPPTGIPRSRFQPAKQGDRGAKLTADGMYVVTRMENEAYQNPKKERPPFLPPIEKEEEVEEELPDELTCRICNDLINDPFKTPCCKTSYCGECIKTRLLENEDSHCPHCKKELTPMQLVEDRIVKQEAIAFKNRNSYKRKDLRDLLPRSAAAVVAPTVPKKVTYGSYGSVYGGGKTEVNQAPKNLGYVVTKSNQVISIDEQKDEDKIKIEIKSEASLDGSTMPAIPPLMSGPPPSILPIMPMIPTTQSGPPPIMPPMNPNVPPPGPPPTSTPVTPVAIPSAILPPTSAPPPIPPPGVPPPTSAAPPKQPVIPPTGPPPMMPPRMPPGMMPPGMMPPGMIPPGMIPPGMPPMPMGMGWPFPGYGSMPNMHIPNMPHVGPPPSIPANGDSRRNYADRRDRSRSHSNRRSRSRDRGGRRSRSRDRRSSRDRGDRRDRRSRSRDRRSRSRDRRSRSRDRSRRDRDRDYDRIKSRSTERDSRRGDRSRRDRSRDKSRDKRDSRDRSKHSKERVEKKAESRSASKSRSISKEKVISRSPSKSPVRTSKKKTRDRTPEEANSDEETRRKRKRDRHSKDESKKSKKHSRKAKSRDRDRRNVEKSSEDQTEKPEVSKKETITEPKNSDEVSLEANGSPVRTKRKRDEGSDTEDKSKITNDNKRRSTGSALPEPEEDHTVEQEQTITSTTQEKPALPEVHPSLLPLEIVRENVEEISWKKMEEKTSEIQEQNEDSTEAPKSFDSSKWKPVEIDEAEIDKIVNSPIDQEMDMEMEDELEFSNKSDELEIHTKEDKDLLGDSKLPDLRTVISRSSSLSDASDNYVIKPMKKITSKSKDDRKSKKKKKEPISDKHVRHISYEHRSHRDRSTSKERRRGVEKKKKSRDKKDDRKTKKSKKSKRSHYSDDSDASVERTTKTGREREKV